MVKKKETAVPASGGSPLDPPIVLKPPIKCECGWSGTEPTVAGAGCPSCGERLQ